MNAPLLLTLALPLFPLRAARADVVSIEAARDNTLYEDASGSLSNGAGEHLFSGLTGEGLRRRALVGFDVAAVVPAGATILSATLRMNMSMSTSAAEWVDVHRVLVAWGEGDSEAPGQEGGGAPSAPGDATWLHSFYPGTSWSNAGGDYAPTASASTLVNSIGGYSWFSALLTADVQAMLDDPSADHGWLLKHQVEGPAYTAKRFDSAQELSSGNRPRLLVEYAPAPACGATNFCSSSANSTGSPAVIGFVGSCVTSDDDFTLIAGPLPDRYGIFFYSQGMTAGGSGLPFGNGTRCVGDSGATIFRLPPQLALGNSLERQLDFAAPPAAAGQIDAGSSWNFQAWFRDPAAGGAAFDLSDGLQVLFD